VKLLLGANSDSNLAYRIGETPLFVGSKEGYPNCAEPTHKANEDPLVTNQRRSVLLQVASQERRCDIV